MVCYKAAKNDANEKRIAPKENLALKFSGLTLAMSYAICFDRRVSPRGKPAAAAALLFSAYHRHTRPSGSWRRRPVSTQRAIPHSLLSLSLSVSVSTNASDAQLHVASS